MLLLPTVLSKQRIAKLLASGLIASASLVTASCRQIEPSASASAPPPTPVQVETLSEGTLEDSSEFVGNLEAIARVEVRPESQGRIQEVLVQPGQFVEAGQPLLVLEPDQTIPQFEGAQASVSVAQASRETAVRQKQVAETQQETAASNLELQRVNLERAEYLLEQGVIGQFDFDRAQFNYESAQNQLDAAQEQVQAAEAAIAQADASIQQAQAQANSARVPVEFKIVTAPISGFLGDLLVNLGDYVSTGQAIATIAQNDALDLRINLPSNRSQQLRAGLPVELIDPNNNERLSTGQVTFISPTVDATAQTILIKAQFANVDGSLRDGQYVQARIIWETQPGVLVPTTAISRISGQNFVFVVSEATAEGGEPQTVVQLSPVQLGDIQGDRYQVIDGLQTGDRIATSNILKLRDGVPVAPEN